MTLKFVSVIVLRCNTRNGSIGNRFLKKITPVLADSTIIYKYWYNLKNRKDHNISYWIFHMANNWIIMWSQTMLPMI